MESLPDALKAVFERGNAVQTFWNFYITVSLAFLAFFGNAQRSRQVAMILSVAFLAFAAVNAKALSQRAAERQQLYELALQANEAQPGRPWTAVLKASKPPATAGLLSLHFAADFGVLLGIWVLTLRDRQIELPKPGP
jgi:hypothetical protein